jgi:hypothetical protein
MNILKYAILIAVLLFATHAKATTLLSLPITTAIDITTTTPIQIKDWPPENLSVHCNFAYGSSGETVDAYVQISVDGGSKWVDVAECHFTTASLRELYDISSLPSAVSSHIATDGSLIANAANGGMISWRVQYVSTGTYADGTTLQIDLQGGRSRTQP